MLRGKQEETSRSWGHLLAKDGRLLLIRVEIALGRFHSTLHATAQPLADSLVPRTTVGYIIYVGRAPGLLGTGSSACATRVRSV